jgi:hypothetical protein
MGNLCSDSEKSYSVANKELTKAEYELANDIEISGIERRDVYATFVTLDRNLSRSINVSKVSDSLVYRQRECRSIIYLFLKTWKIHHSTDVYNAYIGEVRYGDVSITKHVYEKHLRTALQEYCSEIRRMMYMKGECYDFDYSELKTKMICNAFKIAMAELIEYDSSVQ